MNWPLFFDRFGLIVFGYLFIDALYDLFISKRRKNKKDKWSTWIRLFIGLAGLVVDGTFVVLQDIFMLFLFVYRPIMNKILLRK